MTVYFMKGDCQARGCERGGIAVVRKEELEGQRLCSGCLYLEGVDRGWWKDDPDEKIVSIEDRVLYVMEEGREYDVPELADMLHMKQSEIQRVIRSLIDQGLVNVTGEWKYVKD